MKDVRFGFERPTWWYQSRNYSQMGEVAYAQFCFKDDRDEIYEIVRDLETEWKQSNENVDYSSLIEPMYTQLVFINFHVYPLEIEEGGTYNEGWEVVMRGDVHVRVKGNPDDEDVWHDIKVCLDDVCGEVNVIL